MGGILCSDNVGISDSHQTWSGHWTVSSVFPHGPNHTFWKHFPQHCERQRNLRQRFVNAIGTEVVMLHMHPIGVYSVYYMLNIRIWSVNVVWRCQSLN